MADAGHIYHGKYTRHLAHQLFRFGGWLTVTNVVGPMLVQSDRFVIGGVISASAVTIYVIPYELTTQALIFVGAITTIAFPVITNLIHISPQQALLTFHRWLYRIACMMFIMMLFLASIMPALLHVWVGQHVSNDAVLVGQILCAGVFFNSVGAMYYALLHAQGHTKSTAILHLIELPLYILLMMMLINVFGIIGCAIAWTTRIVFDTVSMILMSKMIDEKREQIAVQLV